MASMTPSDIAEKLGAQFGDKILETDLEAPDPYCLVAPDAIDEVSLFCRDELGFEYLRCLSGVDYLDNTALRYRVFKDIWAARTLLLRQEALPELSNAAAYDAGRGS